MVAGEEDRAILNKQINNLTNQLLPTYLHVIATHHCWSMSGCYTVSGGIGQIISHSLPVFADLPMQQNNTHLRFQGYQPY